MYSKMSSNMTCNMPYYTACNMLFNVHAGLGFFYNLLDLVLVRMGLSSLSIYSFTGLAHTAYIYTLMVIHFEPTHEGSGTFNALIVL